MKYVLTNDRGQRIGEPVTERKDIRSAARAQIRTGTRIMIFYADDAGVLLRYSSKDTAAVYQAVRR